MSTIVKARRTAAERRGRWAERLCMLRLNLTGWRILARRHTAPRGTGLGEIDIVAKRGRVIAFIEVKARPRRDLGLLAVSTGQQRRIARAAAVFLARRPDLADCSARFDVMIVGPGLWPYRLTNAWEIDNPAR
jgi:putative endonuclease